MTKSVFFFFVSLLVLLEATSTTASARNATSELRYGGCAPGVTVGECITGMIDQEGEEGVEAAERRTLKITRTGGTQAVCEGKQYSNCIRPVLGKTAPCTYGYRCKHYGQR
ncbi:hypothetical protein AALP_AAs67432U000200 [Arabis alpina]|uniref:Uncharacterized protein n=1 Tax=Arabis alpina TaxID=50452 RepID=A0A087FZV9_ARAAL|nr:hypothetical protein AALP_AAs67432U000200 [Arabis alpina]